MPTTTGSLTGARTTIPKSASSAEIAQAWSLIQRGKAWATAGDPKMQRIVNALADLGVTDVNSAIRQRRIAEELQEKARREARIPQPPPAQGVSGIGLSPSEYQKRKFLLDTGAIQEGKQSSKSFSFKRVAPLPTVSFFNAPRRNKQFSFTELRQQQKQSQAFDFNKLKPNQQNQFFNYVRSQQFNTNYNRDTRNRLQRLSGYMETKINQLRKTKNKKEANQIKRSITERIRTEGALFGLGFSSQIYKLIGGVPDTVSYIKKESVPFIKRTLDDPKSLVPVSQRFINSQIKAGKDFGKLFMIEPSLALGKLGAEWYTLKLTSKGWRASKKLSSKAVTRLSPRFKKIIKGTIKLPSIKKGKILKITIGKSVKKIKIPLKEQAKIAGKRVTGVSVQADRLVNLIRNKKIVRKPIPGELALTTSTKKLLSKFDKGKISKSEFKLLNRKLGLETGGQANLLERSFFADPKGRFRPSRIGATPKDATLKDILTGNFTFKTQKPQILIFEDVVVSKFPKSLQKVAKKLKSGKTLTKKESSDLLKFQLKKTGKFKPIGALTREPEITLAPGEIIKRVKKVGVTLINGKKVDIVRAKVIKPTGITKKLLTKSRKGTLTAKEIRELTKRLKKETGFKPSLSKRTRKAKPVLRLPKTIPRKLRRGKVARRPTFKKDVFRKPVRRITRAQRKVMLRNLRKAKRVRVAQLKRIPKRPVKRPVRRPTKRLPKRPIRRPPRRPVKKPVTPVTIPRLRSKKRKVKRKPIKKPAFSVYARPLKRKKGAKKPKLIRVNKVPLSKRNARNLRNYVVDHSLSRTSQIKKIKGKPRTPKLKVPRNYAKKTSYKFRRYKIVKGKKKLLPKGRVIEKRKRLLDTRSEKKGITLRRRIKQISKPVKRITSKRTQTPTQKKVMLQNLAKGRAKRMTNLKKKKR